MRTDNASEGEGLSISDIGNSGEGNSSGKGKGADPGNWGAVQFEETEADPEEQRHTLAFWNSMKFGDAKTLQELYDLQKDFNEVKEIPVNGTTPIKEEPADVDMAKDYSMPAQAQV